MPFSRLRVGLMALTLLLPSFSRAADAGATVARAVVKEPYGLEVTTPNPSAQPIVASQPAGVVWQTASGEKLLVLRSAESPVAAKSSVAILLPVVQLSPVGRWQAGAAASLGSMPLPPALQPLLTYLANRNDVPRETSQLVGFALLEDISFARWQQFLVANRLPGDKGAAAGKDVAGALDALTILRAIAPERTFALADDPELKLRALHDPALRPVALQLYHLAIPGDVPAGAVAPDLGQLLHTKPGDNCPICRMRQQAQASSDIP